MATDDPVPAPDNDDWIDFLHWAADGEFLDDAHGIVRVVEKPGSYGDLYAEYLAAGGTER